MLFIIFYKQLELSLDKHFQVEIEYKLLLNLARTQSYTHSLRVGFDLNKEESVVDLMTVSIEVGLEAVEDGELIHAFQAEYKE